MRWIQYLSFSLLLLPLVSLGQSDTKVFTQEQLLWFLDKYHPVSVQGNLMVNMGESTVRRARGAFDPYLHSNIDQKNFDNKEYYSILNSGLKVPTWYGVELKTGIDQNRGLFLNPENNVPQNGLWYAGISVPLGQGLFIDKRRASLRQAKLFAESSYAERQKLLNDLHFDAIQQYWKWVSTWNQLQVFEESVQLAIERFNGVKLGFEYGDQPAIDTLEAFIQVQNRQMNRNQSKIAYQNASLDLSNFLWFENNTPLVISDSLRAPTYAEIELEEVLSANDLQNMLVQLADTHPEMQLYDLKLSSMELDKRLKREGLKPKLNLNYNALNESVGDDQFGNYSMQNYKWGLEFSFPLFLRQQRGDLQLTQLKIQDTELNQTQKLLELQNKVRSYYNEQLVLADQVTLYSDAVNNYRRLLGAERQKFTSGESSLFLINSRETNLIQARLKLIELVAKYNIAHTGLIWASGHLY